MSPPLTPRPRLGLLHVLALALLLVGVAAADGRPAVFGDTPFYASQGEYLAQALGYPKTPLTAAQKADPDSVLPGSVGAEGRTALAIAGARSPVYGLFLFLSQRAGALWLTVALQALASAWATWLAARCLRPGHGAAAFWTAGAALVTASSLPFYAAFIMPDVFAGAAAICVILLMLCPQRLSRAEQAGVWALLGFGLAAHLSNLASLIGTAAVGAALLAARRAQPAAIARRLAAVASAGLTALIVLQACAALYAHQTGVRQLQPPFLVARLLADGPGRDELNAACPDPALPVLCRFKGQPFADSEDVLWSIKPGVGLYMRLSYDDQARLKREELPFLARALAHRPAAALGAMARNAVTQLALSLTVEPLHGPAEFLSFPWWKNTSIWAMTPGRMACETAPSSCRMRLPAGLIQATQGAGVIAALLALILLASPSDLTRAIAREGDPDWRLIWEAAALVAAVLLLNAAICGALAGPFPRYGARLAWLLPLIASIALSGVPWRALLRRRSEAGRPATASVNATMGI